MRQLENLCHWLTVMAPAQVVEVADLPPEMREQPAASRHRTGWRAWAAEADRLIALAPGEVFDRLTRDFERTLIRRALAATGGCPHRAARLLGIGRNTISRKIQELGMDERAPEAEAGADRPGRLDAGAPWRNRRTGARIRAAEAHPHGLGG